MEGKSKICFLPLLVGILWQPLVDVIIWLIYNRSWREFEIHDQNIILYLPYLIFAVFLEFSRKKYGRREIFLIAIMGTLAAAAPVFYTYVSTRLYHLSGSGGYTGDALILALSWVFSFVTLLIGTTLAILFVYLIRRAKRPITREY